MDLFSLDTVKASNEGISYEILHPATGEPTGASLRLLGSDSAAYREEIERQRDAMLRKRNLKTSMSREEREDRELGLLSSCIVGWDNLQMGGADLEYSRENARMLLTSYPWMRKQVDEAIHDYTLFLSK